MGNEREVRVIREMIRSMFDMREAIGDGSKRARRDGRKGTASFLDQICAAILVYEDILAVTAVSLDKAPPPAAGRKRAKGGVS